MTKKIHTVVAILEAKPDKATELKEALMKVANLSRKEKTCLEYRLHQDNDNPMVFVLYEKKKPTKNNLVKHILRTSLIRQAIC